VVRNVSGPYGLTSGARCGLLRCIISVASGSMCCEAGGARFAHPYLATGPSPSSL
jgi:hypothetical protein